ncbi:discoidin domain-containing protein [Streptomyces sp. H10-C2]|uniref:discoidin domain-containing protein n=1 Tax=unclassified Streptomyces TaxID=2593676 RepID=UPI0024BAB93E|nr:MULTISPECIES: discoidin domain-containing protein [unclassified Streptomyces]MDJ0343586.1 discoidin domain-containing protein [Streptomyces sp. PH10-H1]MDJ0373166.1 discoidin domain-containing protein [Streptomyces sp. H10-C2]
MLSFSSHLQWLLRLRSRGLVLIALAAAVAAFVPLAGAGGPAAADTRRAVPMVGGTAPPPAPHHGVAPASAMVPIAPVLSRTGWTASASDEETAAQDNRAANVLDGDANTLWHSKWSAPATPLPHSLTIDMHRTTVVSALVYRPRAAGANGRVGVYAIALSADGQTWTPPVATGTLPDDSTIKTLNFAAQGTRFVRLTATTEAGHRGPWTSAAEINLLGDPGLPASVVELPVTGWTAAASDEETAAQDNRAANVLDGNADTLWHSKWSGTPAALPHSITLDMHRTQMVSAISYQPRASGVNGRIGAYAVATSLDGITFGAPVATGTWKDDGTVKSASFTAAVTARFVRLTATSEAGGRGPWSSAAEIRLSGPANPAAAGSWGRVTGFPLVPVATALLPNNKLLAWSAYATDRFGGSNGYTQTAIMDLTTGQVTQRRVDNTGHDMFCPGIAMLADGRVLVTGGSNAARASIYDPRTDAWSATADMNIPRGYQAMTLLSNGDAFVLGGSWSGGQGGKDGEVWSAATGTWRKLSGVPVTTTMTADPAGPYRADNHQWLYGTSNGRVLQFGPSKQLNWISTTGDGAITPAGVRSDSPDAMNGNAVAYDIGKLLTLGGGTAYQNVNATRRAYTIDLNKGPQPISTRTGDMTFARAFSNSVVMPDGKVAVFGGQSLPVPFSDATSAMTPEIWNPATGAFTPLATMAVPRNYHSVANLLPDGRIFSGGGGLCGDCATNHFDGAIFTPPYLLNADGTEKPRPAITSTPPASAAYGAKLTVTTSKPVTAFSLVRTGAATHSTDNDQRRVPLVSRQISAGVYELTIPTDPGVATPGNYLLFALDAAGVPSIARTITLG